MNRASQDRATVARYRRAAGFVLGYGIYQSFFDLHGGYFYDPALMAEVKRLNALLDDSQNYDCSSVAEILVLSDEPSCSYATFESGFLQQTLRTAQVRFAKLGAPHDSSLVDDLAFAVVQRYKLVIFLNCFHLSNPQRDLIRSKVLNGNRTVLRCYAPGLFNGATASVAAMRELTGLRFVRAEKSDRVRARTVLNETGVAFLQRGLHAASTSSEPAQEQPEDRAPDPTVIGHEHVWAQLLSVEDPPALALGQLEGRREVVLAMKHLKRWISVYSLNPVLPADFLRTLARQAGDHLYHDRDDTLYASRSYLTLNADGAGERTLRFPRPVDLFGPFTGEKLARRITELVRILRDKETLLIRYSTTLRA